MAYVLGFFAADGSMHRNKRGAYFIEITSIDKEILEKIRNALQSNHALSMRPGKGNERTQYHFQIGSKIMYADLLALGLTPRKSKTITLPLIPEKYFPDFVRGYFDGDGHVYTGTYRAPDRINPKRVFLSGFTSGSRVFLEQLWKQLKEIGIQGGTLYHGSRAYQLCFSAKDSTRLYNIMYQNRPELCLARKRDKFEKYFAIPYTL